LCEQCGRVCAFYCYVIYSIFWPIMVTWLLFLNNHHHWHKTIFTMICQCYFIYLNWNKSIILLSILAMHCWFEGHVVKTHLSSWKYRNLCWLRSWYFLLFIYNGTNGFRKKNNKGFLQDVNKAASSHNYYWYSEFILLLLSYYESMRPWTSP